MMKYLFSNPKAALLFVVATVVSAVMFVGSEEDEGLLAQAIDEQRAGFASDISDLDRANLPGGSGLRVRAEGTPEIQDYEAFNSDDGPEAFMDDGLIDKAEGYNPSPSDDGGDAQFGGSRSESPGFQGVNEGEIIATILANGEGGVRVPQDGN